MNDDELDRRVRALTRSVAPPEDLWPEIASSLAARPRRRSAWAWATAAALVLGGGTWWAGRPDEVVPVPIATHTPAPTPAPAPVLPEPPAEPAALIPDEIQLRAASVELASAYLARRPSLDPSLSTAFDENLGLIDDAITRSRAALREQPDDPGLRRALDRAYRHKLSLLQRATEVETRR